MSYEEFKKRMEEKGIDVYNWVIPYIEKVPKHCYKCGELEYDNHKCKELFG